MDVMTAPDFWSGQDRMLTVEDMENMPDDEFRYERGVPRGGPVPGDHRAVQARHAWLICGRTPTGPAIGPEEGGTLLAGQ